MKGLEFKTSKGNFILSDENYYLVNEIGVKTAYLNNKKQFEYVSFIRLSEITEEQASEIVDEKPSFIDNEGNVILNYRNYLYHNIQAPHIWKQSAIQSLYSLLKSKGVYLYDNKHNTLEAEQKTFYNPVIFKL